MGIGGSQLNTGQEIMQPSNQERLDGFEEWRQPSVVPNYLKGAWRIS